MLDESAFGESQLSLMRDSSIAPQPTGAPHQSRRVADRGSSHDGNADVLRPELSLAARSTLTTVGRPGLRNRQRHGPRVPPARRTRKSSRR